MLESKISDEQVETSLEQIATECRDALNNSNPDSEHNSYLIGLLETSLVDENLIEHIVEELVLQHEQYSTRIDETEISNMVRGLTFESLALASLPTSERQYKEFERFLLWSLKDPRVWLMDWFDTEKLTKVERKILATYMRVKPDENELRALRNNDAIAIKIETDPESNKRVAVITGVIEAKLHAVRQDTRDEEQMIDAPQKLNETIRRFRRVYPLIVKGLDLTSAGFPDEIDILDTDELTYEIVHPQDIEKVYRNGGGVPKAYAHCDFKFLPVSRSEVKLLSNVLAKYVKAKLPQEILQP